jgi:hypothetical protein
MEQSRPHESIQHVHGGLVRIHLRQGMMWVVLACCVGVPAAAFLGIGVGALVDGRGEQEVGYGGLLLAAPFTVSTIIFTRRARAKAFLEVRPEELTILQPAMLRRPLVVPRGQISDVFVRELLENHPYLRPRGTPASPLPNYWPNARYLPSLSFDVEWNLVVVFARPVSFAGMQRRGSRLMWWLGGAWPLRGYNGPQRTTSAHGLVALVDDLDEVDGAFASWAVVRHGAPPAEIIDRLKGKRPSGPRAA